MPLVEYSVRCCSSISDAPCEKVGLFGSYAQAFNFPSWKCRKKRNGESTGCDVRKGDGIYVWRGKMWSRGGVRVESTETP